VRDGEVKCTAKKSNVEVSRRLKRSDFFGARRLEPAAPALEPAAPALNLGSASTTPFWCGSTKGAGVT